MKRKTKRQLKLNGENKKIIADIMLIKREIAKYNAAKRREYGILG